MKDDHLAFIYSYHHYIYTDMHSNDTRNHILTFPGSNVLPGLDHWLWQKKLSKNFSNFDPTDPMKWSALGLLSGLVNKRLIEIWQHIRLWECQGEQL